MKNSSSKSTANVLLIAADFRSLPRGSCFDAELHPCCPRAAGAKYVHSFDDVRVRHRPCSAFAHCEEGHAATGSRGAHVCVGRDFFMFAVFATAFGASDCLQIQRMGSKRVQKPQVSVLRCHVQHERFYWY